MNLCVLSSDKVGELTPQNHAFIKVIVDEACRAILDNLLYY